MSKIDLYMLSRKLLHQLCVLRLCLSMVAAIAGSERRKVATIDIGSAFLRGKFEDGSDPIIMRLDKEMADALCKIDPGYKVFKRPDGSLYVQLKKPLYGLIEVAKLWFDEISRTLQSLGFKQNAYDECCWNRDFKGKQHTIVIHVDDILSTCELDEANQQLISALKAKYEHIGRKKLKRREKDSCLRGCVHMSC